MRSPPFSLHKNLFTLPLFAPDLPHLQIMTGPQKGVLVFSFKLNDLKLQVKCGRGKRIKNDLHF